MCKKHWQHCFVPKSVCVTASTAARQHQPCKDCAPFGAFGIGKNPSKRIAKTLSKFLCPATPTMHSSLNNASGHFWINQYLILTHPSSWTKRMRILALLGNSLVAEAQQRPQISKAWRPNWTQHLAHIWGPNSNTAAWAFGATSLQKGSTNIQPALRSLLNKQPLL